MIHETTTIEQPAEPQTCSCVHHNALTCIAEQHHMSRFNALLVFATSVKDGPNGCCACLCHRDAAGQPVSESEWTIARTKPKRLPGNRQGYLNFRKQKSEVPS